ncbi:putative Patched family domain containing protein [Neospora caninum Liverpool]|uniref:Patched family domain containing protein,putative n=1 Tax=Neospora caninum (strain Liverpool) TaxID=572307 RepID=F0VCJ8_NEOCL|nr:putative Patched family domain containing protein [Neospora caninum Liverpool]CBZ51687.1 putative Patched family domain containing protein [Neospora caninum Liverpool]CEL65641.1 TPA: Patched family domain containing protein,putative [Neospora caninum Liverpool]|eukprot:XP_003881720.1 putative Patched family domain containing protein [Neospora caninum Liverpool]
MGGAGVGPRWWRSLTRRYVSFCHELLVQKESIVAAIGEGFGKWALVCYRYPYHVMLASLVLCVAMASGLLPPTPVWIDGAEKLYSLPYSRARDDGALHTSYFGDVLGRKSVVIVKHKDEGTNILTWKYLEVIQHLDAIIRGREVDPVGSRKLVIPRTFGNQNDSILSQPERTRGTEKALQESNLSFRNSSKAPASGDPLGNSSAYSPAPNSPKGMDDQGYMTFEDICLINPFGECAIDSVLKFGLHEMRQMGLLPDEPEVWVFDGTVYNTKQVGFIPEYYLGGVTKEQCWRQMPLDLAKRLLPPSRIRPLPDQPGFAMVDIDCITKAQAAMLQYDADGRSQFEDRNMMWERLFIQILKDNQTFGDLEVSFQAFRSRDDELRASTSESKDVVYVVFTFFILATYSTALNFSCDLYRNKLFSALMGFGAAFMGLGAGMGIVAYMGMPMVPTVLICPFLVLGIGVDDMFVVMNCYCVSYTIHDPEERCIQALRISGLGISITTLTNLISFGVGAFSTYMSIRNFCVYSAMALFMGYVFVLTFFFPTLCIDARREECARVCPFCLPDISDRQKVAQERLAEMTAEERKVVQSMASLSQEELIAYKVNVFYEEQAIRKAARKRRDLGEKDGTAKHARPDGPARFLRRLTEALTAHRPLPQSPSPASFQSALPPQPINDNSGSASSGPGFVPNPRSTSATSTASLPPAVTSGSASSRWSNTAEGNEKRKTKSSGSPDVPMGGEGMKTGEKSGFGGDTYGLGPGRCQREGREDAGTDFFPRLTTTIGGLPPDLAREALYEEPRGNVGRKWREFFLCYYGPVLMWFPVKIAVVITFAAIAAVSAYGFTKLELGLELSELAPGNSYMRRFDADFAHYFNKFDQPTDIFFVDRKKRPANSSSSYGVAGDSPLSSSAPPRRLFNSPNPVKASADHGTPYASSFYSGLDRGDVHRFTSPARDPPTQGTGEHATPVDAAASNGRLNSGESFASGSGQRTPSLLVSPPTLRGATTTEHTFQLEATSFPATGPNEVDAAWQPVDVREMPEADAAETRANSGRALSFNAPEDAQERRLLGTMEDMKKRDRSDAQTIPFREIGEKPSFSPFDREDQKSVDDTSIRTEWWNPKIQAAMRAFHKRLESRPTTSRLVNPLLTMLDDPQIGAKLRMGDKQIFEDTIYYQLVHSKSPYRQFKFDFIWTGRELKTWRMRLLPKYMATSEERAAWMEQLRNDCDEAARTFGAISETDAGGAFEYGSNDEKYLSGFLTDKATSTSGTAGDHHGAVPDEPIYPIPYTYMMIFYESDLGILSSVLVNMLSAGLAMLLVAFVLIPEALAGFLVILMICLIDLALFGFMYFWRVKLHMVSTIALVISIGFAVDYSAHLCHTFTHCKGATREKRVIESLVLMGNPIFHGASSTLLGIMLLGFSESFVFTVFFRMMVMVVAFGASHGMLLLPVILSWIGPMGHEADEKATDASTACADLSGGGAFSRADKPQPFCDALSKSKCIPSLSFPQSLSHPAEANASPANPTLLTSAKLRSENYRSPAEKAASSALGAGGTRAVLASVEAEKTAQKSPQSGRWFFAKMLPNAGGANKERGWHGPAESVGSLRRTDEGDSFVIEASGHRSAVVHPRAASLPVPLPGRSLPDSLDMTSLLQTHEVNHHDIHDRLFLPYSDQKARGPGEGEATAAGMRPIGAWALGEDEDPNNSCISSPLDYTAHQQARQLKTHRRSRAGPGHPPSSFVVSAANGVLGASSTSASALPSHPVETSSAELELAAMFASSQAATALSHHRDKYGMSLKSQASVASNRASASSAKFPHNDDAYPLASQRLPPGKRSSHASRTGEMNEWGGETRGDEKGREQVHPKECVPPVREPSGVSSELSSAAFSESTTGGTEHPETQKHVVSHPRRISSCGPTVALHRSRKSSSVVSSQHPSVVSADLNEHSYSGTGSASGRSVSRPKRRNSTGSGRASFSMASSPGGTATFRGQSVITVRKGIGVVGFPHAGCMTSAGARGGERRHSMTKGPSSGHSLPSFLSNKFPRFPAPRSGAHTLNGRSGDSTAQGYPGGAEKAETERRSTNGDVACGSKTSRCASGVGSGEKPRERDSLLGPEIHTPGLVHSTSLPSAHSPAVRTSSVGRDGERKNISLPPASRSSSAVSMSYVNPSTHSGGRRSQNSPVSYVSSHASKIFVLPSGHLAPQQVGGSSLHRVQPNQIMPQAYQEKGQPTASASPSLDAPAGSAAKRRNSTGNLMANRGRRELGGVSACGYKDEEQKRGEGQEQRLGRSNSAETRLASGVPTGEPGRTSCYKERPEETSDREGHSRSIGAVGQGRENRDNKPETKDRKPEYERAEHQTTGGGIFHQLLHRGMSLAKTREEKPPA